MAMLKNRNVVCTVPMEMNWEPIARNVQYLVLLLKQNGAIHRKLKK